MPDAFFREDVQKLFQGKTVVMLGDSNIRALYKDVLNLFVHGTLIPQEDLRKKMEDSFLGDKLNNHGKRHNGRDFKEERQYVNRHKNFKMRFYFLTRAYHKYTESVLERISKELSPDLILMSSCCWDISRWGPNGIQEYKENIKKLFSKVSTLFSSKCQIIWLAAPPISQSMKGGFLIPQLEFLKYSLRYHVMEANTFAREIADEHDIDILDMHYHLRLHVEYRAKDGVHWDPFAMRCWTNLLLTHVAVSWNTGLPGRSVKTLSQKEKRVNAIEDKENIPETSLDESDISFADETSFSYSFTCPPSQFQPLVPEPPSRVVVSSPGYRNNFKRTRKYNEKERRRYRQQRNVWRVR